MRLRDHGGDLDRAKLTFGDGGHWLDLSTGINPIPYPPPSLEPSSWNTLPTRADICALEGLAADTYNTTASVVALAGAQAAIQLIPRLLPPGRACVVGPTYNEHAASLSAQGWQVETVGTPEQAKGADLLTVVNPNNPDGRTWAPDALLEARGSVGLLVVDESFVDCTPDLSIAPHLTATEPNVIVLRSFGKFYGLAGARLGFALSGESHAEALRALSGPWAVSGPALAAGRDALGDSAWQQVTRDRLRSDAARLDAMAQGAGWKLVGGTHLFRTYETQDAVAAQTALANAKVWSRVFPYSTTWLRLGLPGIEEDWDHLHSAMSSV